MTVAVADLVKLRTLPHKTKLYLVVQQPARYDSDADEYNSDDFIWYGTVNAAPASDPVTSLVIDTDAACPNGVQVMDRMTVFISSEGYGKWDRAVICAHGDQTLNGAGAQDTLYVAVSSELTGVEAGDYVVVLDEFRFWLRYPRVTESGGNLSWYKDYGFFEDSIGVVDPDDLGLTWTQLGGNDAARREASMPPVPIMGPHVVQFIDPDVGSVDVDFTWEDSYPMSPGAAMMNPWNAYGETDHVGGTWNDNVENPAAKTYNTISGLRGFRTVLEVLSDDVDPIIEFRRGVRYVFTLRRPEEVQDSDPSDAVPITDFQIEDMGGSWDRGGWSASIRILGSQASQYSIIPGSLVIVFAEDTYGTEKVSIGPDYYTLEGRENIVMIGYIANGTIVQDSETGDVTFDILSVSGLMQNRENYPVPIEDDISADEWYETPYLTVDRAAWHYLAWHTNLALIADFYITGDSRFIAAMDFLAQDCYSCIDQFIQDRLVARLTCDRFGRFKMDIDQQVEVAGAAPTSFTLQSGDWIGEVSVEEVNEKPISIVDAGGLRYNGGLVTPFLSHAPGEVSGYIGTPEQRMSLALTDQDDLNTLCGRIYAYLNNKYPRVEFTYAGNWRVMDIWPQEYVAMVLDTDRVSFSASDLFLFREVAYEYDAEAGALFVTVSHELETDDEGITGSTVEVPGELPSYPAPAPPPPPVIPPIPGIGAPACEGRKIIATDVGVFATNDISPENPVWYAVNDGLTGEALNVLDVKRDPFHWWTSGGTERTLWAITGDGIWKLENFPHGTWTQIVTEQVLCDGDPTNTGLINARMDMSIEVEDRYAVAYRWTKGGVPNNVRWSLGIFDGAVRSGVQYNYWGATGGTGPKHNDIAFGQHSGGTLAVGTINVANGGAAGVTFALRTTDSGANWASGLATSFYSSFMSVSCPYVDAGNNDKYWFLGGMGNSPVAGGTDVFVSVDGANTFTTPAWAEKNWKVGTGGNQNRLFQLYDPCKYSIDGGTTWTELPAHGLGVLMSGLVEWGLSGPQCVLIGNYTTGNVYLWEYGMTSWVDKTGNLGDFGPSIINQIDRDTMGSA